MIICANAVKSQPYGIIIKGLLLAAHSILSCFREKNRGIITCSIIFSFLSDLFTGSKLKILLQGNK